MDNYQSNNANFLSHDSKGIEEHRFLLTNEALNSYNKLIKYVNDCRNLNKEYDFLTTEDVTKMSYVSNVVTLIGHCVSHK